MIKALILIVLIVAPLRAQDQRTIDSLRMEIIAMKSEVRESNARASNFAYLASLPHYDVQIKRVEDPSKLSLFLASGFEGRAHIDAGVFGGFGALYKSGWFGLQCGARYEYSSPEPANVGDPIIPARWHPIFEGSLLIFLN